ncbi:transposase [Rhizobium leguminosarum]|uniref:transposase n=1 Tax=Rhizobium leguminosarum TaxID=384 RepID=UPI0021BBBDA3|nr:transposase [Rhizobium leguminosarum]
MSPRRCDQQRPKDRDFEEACRHRRSGQTQLVAGDFYRDFKNRRHLASYLGLAPSPIPAGKCRAIKG